MSASVSACEFAVAAVPVPLVPEDISESIAGVRTAQIL